MYMPDREWNPGKESQAIGRMDRMGQTRDTSVHKLLVGNSVDIWMDNTIAYKGELVGGFTSQAQMMQSAWEQLKNGEM
jgi:SNF2 family DNA or RNA helicase